MSVQVAFVTTRWSRVIKAADASLDESKEALASLCRDYWRPLFYFARRTGASPEEAQDLTQGFLCELLEYNAFARADQERGRFRSFLMAGFQKFMANARRSQSALKRGGGQIVVSLEAAAAAGHLPEARNDETPERHFERNWAFALLDRVMVRLRDEYQRADRLPVFHALQPHITGGENRPGYARLGREAGLSEGAVATALHRMRRRYGELLREEVAETVAGAEEIEDELRYLLRVIAG